MSGRRLTGTALAMGLIAVCLAALTPGPAGMAGSVLGAQRTVDTAGPDALVQAGAGLLAWAVWSWGTLGLVLTAVTALPGLAGRIAHLLLRAVLPAGARRAAALALGMGLGVVGPLLAAPSGPSAPELVTVSSGSPALPAPAPDWPTADEPTPGAPDWPASPGAGRTTGSHVVVRGDCLWRIAEAHLTVQDGAPPSAAAIAAATHAWWHANAAVIGPDPDLIRPGQLLHPPAPPPEDRP